LRTDYIPNERQRNEWNETKMRSINGDRNTDTFPVATNKKLPAASCHPGRSCRNGAEEIIK